MVTSQSGAVVARHDYLPFGAEVATGYGGRTSPWGTADSIAQKFTGQERDAETGLDFFGARYFSGAQGRLTSADAPFNDQNVDNPQSWHLYSYGRNNPLTFIDPTGTTTCDANGDNCHDDVTVDGGSGDGVPYFWSWSSFWNSFGSQAAQTAVNITDSALRFIAAPRDPGCMGRAMGTGIVTGGVVGAYAGLAGGPAAEITVPAFSAVMAAGSGAAAGIGSLVSCMSGTGPASSGGGSTSEYTDTTRPGAVRNIKTNVTPDEFGKNLEANGFAKRVNRSITSYIKGNVQYDVYPVRTSTGTPGAQMKVGGEVVLKIGLQR